MSTRRSRSGRHVRTTTSERRAVARQSIERTSSPMTYSRSESNSVPGAAHLDRRPPVELPQPGEPAGQVPARRELGQHAQPRRAPSSEACRGRRARAGRRLRIVTRSACASPRRVGQQHRAHPGRPSPGRARRRACRSSTAPRRRRPRVPDDGRAAAAAQLVTACSVRRRRLRQPDGRRDVPPHAATCRGDAASATSTAHATTTTQRPQQHGAGDGHDEHRRHAERGEDGPRAR